MVFYVVRVQETIGVIFKAFVSIKNYLWGTAVDAFGVSPCMLHPFEPDIPVVGFEAFGDGVLPRGVFRAIDTAAGEQAGEFGDGDAEDLFGEDVVDALLKIGDRVP